MSTTTNVERIPPGASPGEILLIIQEILQEAFDFERVSRWIEISVWLDSIEGLRSLPDDSLKQVVGQFW